MALIVEDGTIVTNANSYISQAESDTYWGNHDAPTAWTGATAAIKDAALRYATQYLNQRIRWRGSIVDREQVLSWPRAGVEDAEGRGIDSNVVPRLVQDATCELAKAHIEAALNTPLGRRTSSEKLDVLSVTYEPGYRQDTRYKWIEDMLWLYREGSAGQVTLVRS